MRILGLDIGSSSIKAVELDSAFRRLQVLDYFEEKLEEGASQADGVFRLLSGLARRPDRVAVAMPNRQVTFRNLKLPTKDRKAIQTSLAFELEDELPFPLDAAQTSYVALTQGSFGTHLHMGATLKKNVAELISTLSNVGVDPDLITTEAWAYRTILNRTLGRPAQERPILLAQLGQYRSTLYIHWKGQPVYTKEVPWGGVDLTKAIGQDLSVPLAEAERIKVDRAAILSSAAATAGSPDAQALSTALQKAAQPLIQEMRQADLASKHLTMHSLGTVLLSGGPALLPGLVEFIRKRVNVPTENMRALHVLSGGQTEYSSETESSFFLAAALASCMLPPERSNVINFRKGVFVKANASSGWKVETFRKSILAGLLILACFHIGSFAQRSYFGYEVSKSDERIEKAVRQIYGDLPKTAMKTKLASTVTLKKDVQRQLEDARTLAKIFEPDRESPFLALRGLSRSIPKDAVTDLIDYQAGSLAGRPEKQMELTFVIRNPQVADRLEGLLSRNLEGFQKSSVEETKMPGVPEKRWKFTVKGTPGKGFYEN